MVALHLTLRVQSVQATTSQHPLTPPTVNYSSSTTLPKPSMLPAQPLVSAAPTASSSLRRNSSIQNSFVPTPTNVSLPSTSTSALDLPGSLPMAVISLNALDRRRSSTGISTRLPSPEVLSRIESRSMCKPTRCILP
jgi:hypothetical protein